MDELKKLILNEFDGSSLDKFAVIIGSNPSKTARSPLLWNSAFKAHGLNMRMLPMDIEKKNLEKVIDVLSNSKKFIGGSVTIPFKNDLSNILKKNLTQEAKKIGAINCIFRDKMNELKGTNTDGEASIVAFKKKFGDINGKKILLMGLGGAGKAVLNYFLKDLKKGKIYLTTLNKSKFKNINDTSKIEFIDWENKNKILTEIDIVINCTSLGFDTKLDETPLNKNELNFLKKTSIVYDIIYNPIETKLLKISKELSLNTLNGLEMNLLQASIAFNYVVKTNNQNITENAMKGAK